MNIQDFLNKLKNAVLGSEVKMAIHDAIKKAYEDAAEQGNANMEVEMARGTEPTLNDRLGKMDDKDEEVTAQLEQNESVVDDIYKFKGFEVSDKGRYVDDKGVLVLVDDDGSSRVFNELLPFYQRLNVPFCTANVSEWVGEPDRCSVEQLLEIQSYGNEVLSHGESHARLTEITDTQLKKELEDSKKWFEERGLNVKNIARPFGDWNFNVKTMAKKYYRSIRTSDQGYVGFNEKPVHMYELKSLWLGEGFDITDEESGFKVDTFDYYKYYIDKAFNKSGLLIISTHTPNIFRDGWESLLEQVVNYAKTKLDIMTLNDALNHYGNIVEIGNYNENDESLEHYVVSPNGDSRRNGLDYKYLGTNKVFGNEDIDYFDDLKISYSKLTNEHVSTSADLPGSRGGVIYVHKLSRKWRDQSFSFEVFETLEGRKYKRLCLEKTTGREWGAWIEQATNTSDLITINEVNDFSLNTSILDFPLGITYTPFDNASNSTGVPFSGGGTIKTCKVSVHNNTQYYNYQIATRAASGESFKRSFQGDGTPLDWLPVSGV